MKICSNIKYAITMSCHDIDKVVKSMFARILCWCLVLVLAGCGKRSGAGQSDAVAQSGTMVKSDTVAQSDAVAQSDTVVWPDVDSGELQGELRAVNDSTYELRGEKFHFTFVLGAEHEPHGQLDDGMYTLKVGGRYAVLRKWRDDFL